MKSMTGHGRGDAVVKGVRAVVECFSVNRKQSEVTVAAPRDLAWMEPRLREEVLKRVARGKVQVSLVVERAPAAAAVLIDPRRAADFLREARALQKKLGLTGEVRLETVVRASLERQQPPSLSQRHHPRAVRPPQTNGHAPP